MKQKLLSQLQSCVQFVAIHLSPRQREISFATETGAVELFIAGFRKEPATACRTRACKRINL